MNWSLHSLLPTLQKGVEFVENLLPVATSLGAPAIVATVAKAAAAVLETAESLSDRIEEGKVVATSQDQVELKTILGRLQAKNDELRHYIETH